MGLKADISNQKLEIKCSCRVIRQKERGAAEVYVQTHLPSGLVVLQVHEGARVLLGALRVVLLPLAGVHELPGEAVAVVDVVTAAAPQPIAGEVAGSRGPTAAAGGQLPLATRPADRVHHPRRADGVGEGRLSAPWKRQAHTGKNRA